MELGDNGAARVFGQPNSRNILLNKSHNRPSAQGAKQHLARTSSPVLVQQKTLPLVQPCVPVANENSPRNLHGLS